jgi:hypothetical protein
MPNFTLAYGMHIENELKQDGFFCFKMMFEKQSKTEELYIPFGASPSSIMSSN